MMEYRCGVKFCTKVSLVVCPVDHYIAEPRTGANINVFLSNHPRKPIRKTDGYYVFTDLPEGTYDVVAQSDVYLDEKISVSLAEIDPKSPVVFLTLKPNSAYPFPDGATLLRAAVRDSEGNPLDSVKVKAVILSADCAKAKLAQGGLKKGLSEMFLVNVAGKVSVGDVFLIKEKEEVQSEYCRITEVLREKQCFKIAESLQYDHNRGAALLPVIETRTDHNGEVVVYFRNIKTKHFDAQIEFSYENKIRVEELKLAEGEMKSLGIIKI